MKFNIYLKALLLAFTIIFIASCDKDFNEIGSDVIGENHYGFEVDSSKTVVAYNQAIGPVQTNNLPLNALGFYNHPKFGKTTANFVTQLELVAADPKFYNPTDLVIDSVYLYVPYFVDSDRTVKDSETGDSTYELDSIYGGTGKFKLSVYESGYYLRDYDPSGGFQETQKYYSDQNSIFDANKIGLPLNDDPLAVSQNEEFYFKTNEYKITYQKDGEEVVKERKAPGIWMDLNKNFFKNKIVNAPAGKLLNNNVFKDYFRGLYFKAEELSSSPSGAMAMLNFKQGKIVIEYEDETSATDSTRKKKSMTINLGGNSVNVFENAESAEFTSALTNANPTTGDERLYLKGQQGSIAVIDLFDPTTDLVKALYVNDLDQVVPKTDKTGHYKLFSGSNDVSDEIDQIKVDNWLINEANLTFTIDKDAMATSAEPYRIYLYDLDNRRPIYDYYSDNSTRADTKFNKVIHGGIIDTQKVLHGRGIRYKIRLTNHVRNLIKNDSTNVRLGLVITESINTTSNVKLKTSVSSVIDRVPTAAVMNPIGTILYGSKPIVNPADSYDPTGEKRKLKLKIYYTKPD